MGHAVASTLQSRRIRLTFQLTSGSFNREGEPDKVVYDYARVQTQISAMGGYEYAQCRLHVFGLAQDVMERLSIIQNGLFDIQKNYVTIEAGDRDGNLSVIFLGAMITAAPEYNGAPDVPFIVEAMSGVIGSLQPSQPRSWRGAVPVATIMQTLADELGATLENNGVTATVTDMSLGGTPLEKVQRLATASATQFWYLPEINTLAIAPRGSSRAATSIKISPETGLIGWPTRIQTGGVSFSTLFNPYVQHGCPVTLGTSVASCRGDWYISSMVHRLDSETPGGAWQTEYFATGFGSAARR